MAGHAQSLSEILSEVDRQREAGRRTVLATGCFDVLHVGHVRALAEARMQGDWLIVGVNDDDVVRRLKGPGRPLNPAWARCEVLAALASVDAVCIFQEETPVDLILRLRPDVFVKGGDYTPAQLPEAEAVKRTGGRVHIARYHVGFSTSLIVQRRQGSDGSESHG